MDEMTRGASQHSIGRGGITGWKVSRMAETGGEERPQVFTTKKSEPPSSFGRGSRRKRGEVRVS